MRKCMRNAMCIAARYIAHKENKIMFINRRSGWDFLRPFLHSIFKTPVISSASYLNQLGVMATPLTTLLILSLILLLEDR